MISDNISKKIVLFEINKGLTFKDDYWIKESPSTWKIDYHWDKLLVDYDGYGKGNWGVGTYGKKSSMTFPSSSGRSYVSILGSLEINQVQYLPVDNPSQVEDLINTYYWDSNNQVLYVHYDGFLPSESLILGVTYGYSYTDIYFSNIYYEGRIKAIPSIKVQRDNLFKSKSVFVGGDITLINNDGEFYNFGDLDIYGQRIQIKWGLDGTDYEDFDIIYTGYINKWQNRKDDTIITVKDERQNLERKLPINAYYQSTYPDLNNANEGKSIGIGWGIFKKAKAICLNDEESSPSNYDFKFIDTTYHAIKSIDKVYVNDLVVTPTSVDLNNGTFSISSSNYQPGQKVKVDGQGYVDDGDNLIDNPLDIIEDLLHHYAGIPYDDHYYNQVEWESVKASAPLIGIYKDSPVTIIDIITEITSSLLGTFILQGDGRFSIKIVDLEKPMVAKINRDELLYDSPGRIPTVNKTSEYLSSCRVQYNSESYYINKDYEDDLVKKYRSYKEQVFKTVLVNKADAITFSENIMKLYGGVGPEYSITVKTPYYLYIQLEDLIALNIAGENEDPVWIKGEVILKSVDYSNNTINLTLRHVDYIDDPNELVIYNANSTTNDVIVQYSDDPDYIIIA